MTDAAADAGLRHQIVGPVATVTLCRPVTRDAQWPRLGAALSDIGATLAGSVRVVVIRAEGESFSAGLDQLEIVEQALTWSQRPDLVTVAAVHGHAIGAGFQLALACDLRVVAHTARFAVHKTSMCLDPALGGTRRLVEAVGYSRALEISVTGREIDAREALQLGLATVVVPLTELDHAVADLVAALTSPPHGAVTAAKRQLRNVAYPSRSGSWSAERSAEEHPQRVPAGGPGGNKGA